jgi:hypothetical protein
MEELATLLRRERWLLGLLLFRLTETRHMLAARETRFLGWAVAETEQAVQRVREAELLRATVIARIALELDVSEDDLTLAALAEHSPEPFRQIFAEHRQAFLQLCGDIHEATLANRKLAARGSRALTDLLSLIEGRVEDPAILHAGGRRTGDPAVAGYLPRPL